MKKIKTTEDTGSWREEVKPSFIKVYAEFIAKGIELYLEKFSRSRSLVDAAFDSCIVECEVLVRVVNRAYTDRQMAANVLSQIELEIVVPQVKKVLTSRPKAKVVQFELRM